MTDAAYDVSVVVHAADAADELVDCVKAALDQGGVSVQVVIVDDASDDETASLGTRIASAHAGVRLVSRIEPGHRTLAWLDGVAASEAPFVLLVDAGDRLVEGGLAPLAALAIERDADLVGSLERTFRGQLVAKHLMRRALAELGDADLGPGEDVALLFMLRCLARDPVQMADAPAADVRLPPDPEMLGPEDVDERCRARDAAGAIATYLERSEGWDEHRTAWNEFVLGLAARAIAPFPRRIATEEWGTVASMLLECWGAPLVATVLSGTDCAEQLLAALALGAGERLCPKPSKIRRVLLCVASEAEPGFVGRTFGSLMGQTEEVIVVADERATLPDDIYQMVSLPRGRGVLPRCQALQAAIERCEPDAVVFLVADDGDGEDIWDGLVPRSLGLPVGLATEWDEPLNPEDDLSYDAPRLLSRMARAPFATAVSLPAAMDAGALRLLGPRTATLDTLVSQLSVGQSRPMDLPHRLLAMRLLRTAADLFAERDGQAAERAALEESLDALKLVIAARDATIAQLQRTPEPATADDATEPSSPSMVEERRRPWFRDLRRRDEGAGGIRRSR